MTPVFFNFNSFIFIFKAFIVNSTSFVWIPKSITVREKAKEPVIWPTKVISFPFSLPLPS